MKEKARRREELIRLEAQWKGEETTGTFRRFHSFHKHDTVYRESVSGSKRYVAIQYVTQADGRRPGY